MYQIQMINYVLLWEKRLEIENEKQKNQQLNHRFESYTDFPTYSKPCPKERKSIFAQIFRSDRDCQRVYCCYTHEHCQKTQPC